MDDGGVDYFSKEEAHLAELLANKVSLRRVTVKQMSPLAYCAALYDEELALRVVREGLDVDVDDGGGWGFTPLHLCAQARMPDLARALIERGANMEKETKDMMVVAGVFEPGGRRPLHVAAQNGDTSLIEILLEAGAVRDARDFDGHTPYLIARMYGQQKAADLLRVPGDPDPAKEWLDRRKLAGQRAARARLDAKMTPTGPFLVLHVIPDVWSIDECVRARDAVERKASSVGWTSQRHAAYATTDIPACEVEDVFPWVEASIRERVFPALCEKYPVAMKDLNCRDLFFVKYEAKPGAQSGLDLHRDGSLLSFNILLNPRSEFDGGGTYVEAHDRVYEIEQGNALIHSGQLRHGGHPVTRGVRYILVGFVDVEGDSVPQEQRPHAIPD